MATLDKRVKVKKRTKFILDKTHIYIVMLYIYAFKNIILNYWDTFKYYDEILALIGLFMLCFSAIKRCTKVHTGRGKWLLVIGFSLFFTGGLLGNIINNFQPDKYAVISDIFINMKFWLWVYLGYSLCKERECRVIHKLDYHAKILTFFFFALTIFDIFFKVFNEYSDIKFGIRAVGLFEGPAGLASVAATFLFIHTISVEKKRIDAWMILNLFILLVTLRYKSFAAISVFLMLLFYKKLFKGKVRIWYIVVLGIVAVVVAWKQIYIYIVLTANRNARTRLFAVGFRIIKDFFPVGTGFATFASYYSGVSYSGVYSLYGLLSIHGLSEDNHAFINDTFWPTVMGQTGLIGSLGFLIILLWLYKKIKMTTKYSEMTYIGMLYIFLYLLLTSFAESSFLHWNSHMIALVMGVVIGRLLREKNMSSLCNIVGYRGI